MAGLPFDSEGPAEVDGRDLRKRLANCYECIHR